MNLAQRLLRVARNVRRVSGRLSEMQRELSDLQQELARIRDWQEITTLTQRGTVLALRGLACDDGERECPVCAGRSRAFLPYGYSLRPHALCPRCGSLERHRLAWLFLQRTDLLEGPLRLLHIGPEPCLERVFRQRDSIDYVSADIDGDRAMREEDIQHLSFDTASFDAVYCSHVLEHVADDRQAMREMLRVLKPGGWALVMVPVRYSVGQTVEGPDSETPEERRRQFGSPAHRRAYGTDVADRLREVGFSVREDRLFEELSPEDRARYALKKDIVYLCTRPEA